MDIISSFGFGRKHVAPILSKLMMLYPKLQIHFDTIDNTKDLIQHSIDLDIRIGNEIAPNMIAKKLASIFGFYVRRRVIYLNTAYQTALKICKHMIV